MHRTATPHFRRLEYYIMNENEILDTDMLAFWLKEHKMDCVRFQHLRELYENRHPILKEPRKPDWKPDNRILANIPKYIVDTFNGAFIGIPVKTECQDKHFLAKILEIHKANDLDDSLAELSKISSIYGNAFELCYLDENANVRITYFTPLEAFIIYDDSVERRPLYGIRYYFDRNHVMHGTVYTRSEVLEFTDESSLHFVDEPRPHFFDGVPLVEYIENDERFGAFEHEESLINAYEKALSEKANDVDAFADNYLLLVSTHTPLARCDEAQTASQMSGITFQLTHPLRGATWRWAMDDQRITHFNSRTPCEVRHLYVVSDLLYIIISTHAPLARCDGSRSTGNTFSGRFQLTHLLRGATPYMV